MFAQQEKPTRVTLTAAQLATIEADNAAIAVPQAKKVADITAMLPAVNPPSTCAAGQATHTLQMVREDHTADPVSLVVTMRVVPCPKPAAPATSAK
jgi:hypothetical protein